MRLTNVLLFLCSVAFAQTFQLLDFDRQNHLKSLDVQLDLKDHDERIINGLRAAPGQFPYYMFLVVDSISICGGSLIRPNWVLTV